ncbi:MAG: hypothetical protein PHS92_04355 [Candidatus Gracilibacteria bacterium]|nr:hypothetical protein [Candidatus Gracilibacteria bacterium]
MAEVGNINSFEKELLGVDFGNDRKILSDFFKTKEGQKFLKELNKTSVFETLLTLRKMPQVIENMLEKLKKRALGRNFKDKK